MLIMSEEARSRGPGGRNWMMHEVKDYGTGLAKATFVGCPAHRLSNAGSGQ